MTSEPRHGPDDPRGPDDPLGPEPPPWEAFDEPAPGRGRRLLVLAAIPWLVVAVLMVRTFSGAGTSSVSPEAPATPLSESPQTGSDPVTVTDAPDPVQSAIPGPEAVALRFGARTAPGPGDAGAVATVVARAWLGAIGPEPEIDVGSADGPPVYVDHLAVEAVDIPTPDTAVVTVVAVVMEADEGSYTAARVVRVGVPIALDSTGARPAGQPWWLPPPDLALRPVTWTPVDDPDALARAGAALAAAGYRDVAVVELATSPSWPLRVSATAVRPGSDEPREHVVWLRDHLGDLVVAGALPATPGAPVQPPTDEEER